MSEESFEQWCSRHHRQQPPQSGPVSIDRTRPENYIVEVVPGYDEATPGPNEWDGLSRSEDDYGEIQRGKFNSEPVEEVEPVEEPDYEPSLQDRLVTPGETLTWEELQAVKRENRKRLRAKRKAEREERQIEREERARQERLRAGLPAELSDDERPAPRIRRAIISLSPQPRRTKLREAYGGTVYVNGETGDLEWE